MNNRIKRVWLVLAILAMVIIIGATLPSFVKARSKSSLNACVNNLRQIDSAKEQWAMANDRTSGEDFVVSEVNEYIKGNTTPVCPHGGTYVYNPIGVFPECSCSEGKIVAEEHNK